MADEFTPVAVSRRIGAPASDIFAILTDPVRHLDLDGSEMLRGAVTTARITAVGDVFVMRMYFAALGEYEMNNHVVEYEPDRRIGWEPEAGRGHSGEGGRWGHRWSYQLTPVGPGETVVTEIYDCSRAPEAERRGMEDGKVWIESTTETLERLDKLSTAKD
jgi:Polyketide cyclase / dehydrase and lipid transport